MTFSSTWLWNMYNNVTHELEEGNMERLPELHAIACCLKEVCTADAAAAIEECRRACGGHRYMSSSNFPASYGMVTAAETYEGENTVLYLQTARYLVKCWQQSKGPDDLPLTVKYLKSAASSYSLYSWENTLPCLLQAYQQVSAGLVNSVIKYHLHYISSIHSHTGSWDCSSPSIILYSTLPANQHKLST
ncbi:acyl-coenzyme A oxidase 1-like [Lycorma delicatula]|uniref:acyl-coenzyme A oxidase 1-like n=1 Tax=Lycorma delicatula TaxID=130591 RepID=UPI003F516C07